MYGLFWLLALVCVLAFYALNIIYLWDCAPMWLIVLNFAVIALRLMDVGYQASKYQKGGYEA